MRRVGDRSRFVVQCHRIVLGLVVAGAAITLANRAHADVTPSIKADKSSLSITLWPDNTMDGDLGVNVTAGLQQSSGAFGSCTKYADINASATNGLGATGADATINNSNGLCSFNPWDATPNPIYVDLTDQDIFSGYYVFDYSMCPSPSYQATQQTGIFSIVVSANSSDWSTSTGMGEIDIPYTLTCMPDSTPTVGALSASPSSLSVAVHGSTTSGNGPVTFTLSRADGGGCALADRAALFLSNPTKRLIDASLFGGSTCGANVPFSVGVLTDAEAVAACTPANAGKTVNLVRHVEADFCNGDCSNGSSNIVETHPLDFPVAVTCPSAPSPVLAQLPAGFAAGKVYKPAGPLTKLTPIFKVAPRGGPVKATVARGGTLSGPLSFTTDVRYADLAPSGCARATAVAALSSSGAVLGRAAFPASCGQSTELTFSPWTGSDVARACGADWDGRVKRLQQDVNIKLCTEGHACDAKDPGQTSSVRATAFVRCGTLDRATQLKAVLERVKSAGVRRPHAPSRLHRAH